MVNGISSMSFSPLHRYPDKDRAGAVIEVPGQDDAPASVDLVGHEPGEETFQPLVVDQVASGQDGDHLGAVVDDQLQPLVRDGLVVKQAVAADYWCRQAHYGRPQRSGGAHRRHLAAAVMKHLPGPVHMQHVGGAAVGPYPRPVKDIAHRRVLQRPPPPGSTQGQALRSSAPWSTASIHCR